MSAPDYTEVLESVRNAAIALRAFMRFSEEVADIACDLAGRGDPAAIELLVAMQDLQAQTGELYVEEN